MNPINPRGIRQQRRTWIKENGAYNTEPQLAAAISEVFLSEIDLAQRLGLSVKALQGWRARRVGPPFLKLGAGPRARVRYRLTDLLDWEASQRVELEPSDDWR